MTIVRRPWFLRFALVLLLALALAACGDGDDGGDGNGVGDLVTDYPPAGEDRFENTKATVEIEVTLPGVAALPFVGQTETVELEGPMLVLRGDPRDADGDGLVDIETEIVELTLTGTSSFGPIEVRQSPERRSIGQVEQQERGQDTPANSFFDIFLEVEILDIGLVGFNEEAIRMEAELIEFPPGFLDQYEGALALPTPLLSVDSMEEFALILDALHVPNPPPPTPGDTPGATVTPESTATEEPTATPAEPTTQQVTLTQQAGCEHTQPGVQSDLFDLIIAALAMGGGPVDGALVEASAEGPGLIQSTASGTTDANGQVLLTFPINQFGPYTMHVDQVTDSDGNPLEIDPASQTSVEFEVGEVCTPP